MKKISKCIIVLFVLLLASIPPVFLLIFLQKPQPKAKEINVLLEYADNAHFPVDTPIGGVAYTIYDGLDQVIVSGITDVNGMITFIVLEAYNQDGNGIHIEFMWQGTLFSINNLIAGEEVHIEELLSFSLAPTFLWEDLTSLPSGTIVDFYFEGVYFDSGIINSNGQIDIVRVIAGTYTLNSTFFSGIEMVVLIDQPTMALQETFIISAQFVRISRILCGNKTGEFYYFYAHPFIREGAYKLDFCLLNFRLSNPLILLLLNLLFHFC